MYKAFSDFGFILLLSGGLGSSIMDPSLLIVLINMSGWVIVGYFFKIYMDDVKLIKSKSINIENDYNKIKSEQQLQQQQIDFMDGNIEDIKKNVKEIKEILSDHQSELIKELKDEIRNLRKN